MYKIEKGIIYEKRYKHPLPLEKMEIDDSIFIPFEKITYNVLNATKSYYSKKSGKKFSVRKVDDGYRLWRLS